MRCCLRVQGVLEGILREADAVDTAEVARAGSRVGTGEMKTGEVGRLRGEESGKGWTLTGECL